MTGCYLLDKDEIMSVLIMVLMLSKDISLESLDASTFFKKKVWDEIQGRVQAQTNRLNNEWFAGKKALTKAVPSPRQYWRTRADRALERESGKNPEIEDIIQLATILRETHECQHGHCNICHVDLTMAQSGWTNASVDRIVPGQKGGKYEKANIQLLCVGCNMLKYWYSLESAKQLIKTLAKTSWTFDGEVVKSNSKPKERKRMTEIEKECLVLPWCARQLNEKIQAIENFPTRK